MNENENENEKQLTRVDALLSQDEAVSTFNFEEFRMTLTASIRHLEDRARAFGRATSWGLGVFLACVAAMPLLQLSGLGEHRWARLILAATGVLAMFTTGVLAAIYQYRYAPALTRAKSELTGTTIAELQQQIADLSRKANGK